MAAWRGGLESTRSFDIRAAIKHRISLSLWVYIVCIFKVITQQSKICWHTSAPKMYIYFTSSDCYQFCVCSTCFRSSSQTIQMVSLCPWITYFFITHRRTMQIVRAYDTQLQMWLYFMLCDSIASNVCIHKYIYVTWGDNSDFTVEWAHPQTPSWQLTIEFLLLRSRTQLYAHNTNRVAVIMMLCSLYCTDSTNDADGRCVTLCVSFFELVGYYT